MIPAHCLLNIFRWVGLSAANMQGGSCSTIRPCLSRPAQLHSHVPLPSMKALLLFCR